MSDSMKDVKMWTHGIMNPYVDGKPHKLYVPSKSVPWTFKEAKRTINEDGGIPLGIDHIDQEVLDKFEILNMLDLLNVGTIHDVYAKDNEIWITEATFTNPMIQQLYDEGKLEALSAVGTIYSKPCNSGKADSIAEQTKIERVDFVPRGACKTCTIDNNKDNTGIFNARLSAKEGGNMPEEGNQENNNEENKFDEEKFLEKVGEKIDEKIEPLTKDIEKIKEKVKLDDEDPEEEPEKNKEGESEVTAKLAKELKEQKEKIEAMEAAKNNELADALVQSDINAGKALPKQKESLVKFAKADPEAYKEHMKNTEPFVPLGKRGLEAGAGGSDDEKTELYMPSDYAKDKKALGR